MELLEAYELGYALYEIHKKAGNLSEDFEISEDDEDFEQKVETFIYEWYGIYIGNFQFLIQDLLPLCSEGKSVLTNKNYRGFSIDNIWIIKKEIK